MIHFRGLVFASGFQASSNANFAAAQKYIDSEVIRQMEPYTPKRTGTKIDIGASGTQIGSGTIEYRSDIARRNYYLNKGTGKGGVNSRKSKGLRGKFWFERMKADHKDEILRGVKEGK